MNKGRNSLQYTAHADKAATYIVEHCDNLYFVLDLATVLCYVLFHFNA